LGSLTIEQRKERLDDAFKVLLTIFTVLLSTVIAFYGRESPEWAAFLFSLYGFTIFSWSAAHLLGGEFEYIVKFLSWFELLGGIIQAIIMLNVGTLSLNGYYNAANWVAALLIYYLVFRYVRSLLAEELRKALRICFLVMIVLDVVFSSLKFLGI
jgi:hypothetical protein